MSDPNPEENSTPEQEVDVQTEFVDRFYDNPQTQLKIMQALNDQNFDLNALVENLNQLAADVSCTGDCQTAKVRNMLKEAYEAALLNFTEAPLRLQTAERDYIVYDQGPQAYYDLLLKRQTLSADEFKKQVSAEHAADLQRVQDELAQLETNMQAVQTLYNNTLQAAQDYVKMQSTKQHLQSSLNTNGRKVFYETRELERQMSYTYMIWVLYYGLIVLYIIFGNFFATNQYANKGFWVYVSIYALLPLAVRYLVQYALQLWVWLKFFFGNLAPKNVYLRI